MIFSNPALNAECLHSPETRSAGFVSSGWILNQIGDYKALGWNLYAW